MPDVVGTGVVRIEVDTNTAERDIDKYVDRTQAKLNAKMKTTGSSSGKSFADAFSKQIDTRVTAALKNIPDAKVGADISEAEKKLAEIKTTLVGLSEGNYLEVGLTDADALKTLDKLRLELDELTTPEHDIRVRANAAAASAELKALQIQMDKLDMSTVNTNKSLANLDKTAAHAGSKGGGGGILLTTILALGPALIPLGAVAAASLGAIVVGAGAAALAVKGVTDDIKVGNQLGKEYSRSLNDLKTGFQNLTQVAATNFLKPFQESVAYITTQFPGLNKLVAEFSVIVGKDLELALHGIIGGFITLEPLFLQLGVDSEGLFAKFDKFANGGGLKKFSDYVTANLPRVEHTLEELGSAIIKIAEALGPLGNSSLGIISAFSKLINAIPLDALKVALPVVTSLYLAFKVYSTLDNIAGPLSSFVGIIKDFTPAALAAEAASQTLAIAQTELGVASTAAAEAETAAGLALDTALGPVGAVIAGVALLATTFLTNSSSADKATVSTQNWTTALINSKGAIDDSVRSAIAKTLLDDDGAKSILSLGVTLNTLTSAVLGNKSAIDAVNAAANKPGLISKPKTFTDALAALQDKFKTSASDARQLADATTAVGTSSELTSAQISDLNTKFHVSDSTAANYAKTIGFVSDSYADNATNSKKYNAALTEMVGLENTANGATQALLGAMQTYSTSAGTAADRSALFGTALVSLQGDALSFTGAMADSFTANRALLDTFKQQAADVTKGVKAGGIAFGDTEKAAIKFTKGVNGALTASIDYTRVGAGPLINQLSAIQSSAEKAAQATYQHELSLKGEATAASDAATVFKTQTHDALAANYKDLGLTEDQAKALADQYFHLDNRDLKATVEAVGLTNINDTLTKIGILLAKFTGQTWVIPVDAQIRAEIVGIGVAGKVAALQKTTSQGLGSNYDYKGQRINNANGGVIEYYASGGVRENHVAQIASSNSVRVWAEPETGGEAYIPLSASKRSRSTDVWRETGKRLGQFADGGGVGGDSSNGGKNSMEELINAVYALAQRDVVLQTNNVELARSANQGNLVLTRVGS